MKMTADEMDEFIDSPDYTKGKKRKYVEKRI